MITVCEFFRLLKWCSWYLCSCGISLSLDVCCPLFSDCIVTSLFKDLWSSSSLVIWCLKMRPLCCLRLVQNKHPVTESLFQKKKNFSDSGNVIKHTSDTEGQCRDNRLQTFIFHLLCVLQIIFTVTGPDISSTHLVSTNIFNNWKLLLPLKGTNTCSCILWPPPW